MGLLENMLIIKHAYLALEIIEKGFNAKLSSFVLFSKDYNDLLEAKNYICENSHKFSITLPEYNLLAKELGEELNFIVSETRRFKLIFTSYLGDNTQDIYNSFIKAQQIMGKILLYPPFQRHKKT